MSASCPHARAAKRAHLSNTIKNDKRPTIKPPTEDPAPARVKPEKPKRMRCEVLQAIEARLPRAYIKPGNGNTTPWIELPLEDITDLIAYVRRSFRHRR